MPSSLSEVFKRAAPPLGQQVVRGGESVAENDNPQQEPKNEVNEPVSPRSAEMTTTGKKNGFLENAEDALKDKINNLYSKLPPWAWIMIAIGVGLLLLLIMYCCCKRWCRKRKKKQEKKPLKNAIDLQSMKNLAESCQEKADNENGEKPKVKKEEEKFMGKLHFSLDCDIENKILFVKVIEATELVAMDLGGTSDPYVKGYLLPATKKKFETKVHRKTLNPVFNEEYSIKVEGDFGDQTLVFRVFDHDKFGKHDMIGEVRIGINEVEFGGAHVDYWKKIKAPTKDDTRLGDICFTLRYIPRSEKVQITIMEAKNLKKMDVAGLSDPFVKLKILNCSKKSRKKKSTVKKNTLNPYFNEAFNYEVPFNELQKVNLVVSVYDYDKVGKNDIIGRVILGCNATGTELRHWTSMIASPRRAIPQWHTLKPVVPPAETDNTT